METVENKSPRKIEAWEIWTIERNKVVKKLAELDIDIKTLSRTDPELVVAKEPLKKNNAGEVMSYREIKAGEMLENMNHDRKGMQLRLDTIDLLMTEDEEIRSKKPKKK